MNTVVSHSMTSPNNKTEECAKFSIDDTSQVFAINEVMVIGREYTLSCWVRSDTASSVIIEDEAFSTTTEWVYVMHTFIADQVDLHFAFVNTGTYYIYHTQLELGNKATDWDVAPEDVEADIIETNNHVSDLNEDAVEAWNSANAAGNTASAAQNRADEAWTYADTANSAASTAQNRADEAWQKAFDAENAVKDANKVELAELRAALDELQLTKENSGYTKTLLGYIKIKTESDDPNEEVPYLELGDKNLNNIAKLRLTNNELRFMDNEYKVAWMTAQKLYIENARIVKELEIGEFSWTEHATKHETVNGQEVLVRSRTGLLWRGGN